jgi:hypothetical protein
MNAELCGRGTCMCSSLYTAWWDASSAFGKLANRRKAFSSIATASAFTSFSNSLSVMLLYELFPKQLI